MADSFARKRTWLVRFLHSDSDAEAINDILDTLGDLGGSVTANERSARSKQMNIEELQRNLTQLRAAMMRQLGGRRRVLVVVTGHDASSRSRMRACSVCLCRQWAEEDDQATKQRRREHSGAAR